MVEFGIANWERSQDGDTRSDLFRLGETAVRTGISDHMEVELGWTAFATERVRDLASGNVDRSSGVGDVTVALKHALGPPDGPAAVRVAVTLPVGSGPDVDGDWSASAMLPLEFDLGKSVKLALTPEVDHAANSERSGHHIAYGSVIGLEYDLTPKLAISADVAVFRNEDPDARHTDKTLGLAVAWQPIEDLQFDVGGVAGIDETAPAVGLYVGVAKRF